MRHKPANSKKVTIDSFRQNLIRAGNEALKAACDNNSADIYKQEFLRLLDDGEAIFPYVYWDDIKTEVVCHLRLAWGKKLTEWLVPDDEYELPF